MSSETLCSVKAILTAQEQKYRRSSAKWKVGYRGLLIASSLMASMAAIVPNLVYFAGYGKDWGAVFAGTAAVLTTIMAALDFESNFRINRRSRHDVQILLLDAEKKGADADVLLAGLQEVIRRRTHDLDKPD